MQNVLTKKKKSPKTAAQPYSLLQFMWTFKGCLTFTEEEEGEKKGKQILFYCKRNTQDV